MTGGGHGIGAAIARRLGRDGYTVGVRYGHAADAAHEDPGPRCRDPRAAAARERGLADDHHRRGLDRLADGRRIVNISSGAAPGASPFVASYAASEAAVESLPRTLAKQLGPRQIAVNAVAPGATLTDINAAMSRSDSR